MFQARERSGERSSSAEPRGGRRLQEHPHLRPEVSTGVETNGFHGVGSTSDLVDSYVGRRRLTALAVVASWGVRPWGVNRFFEQQKHCAHNFVKRFPLTQQYFVGYDPTCVADISVTQRRAVRRPMISSRRIAVRRRQRLKDFADHVLPGGVTQKTPRWKRSRGWAKSRLALSKMTISPGADGGQSS